MVFCIVCDHWWHCKKWCLNAVETGYLLKLWHLAQPQYFHKSMSMSYTLLNKKFSEECVGLCEEMGVHD